jgi:hypothetical protein
MFSKARSLQENISLTLIPDPLVSRALCIHHHSNIMTAAEVLRDTKEIRATAFAEPSLSQPVFLIQKSINSSTRHPSASAEESASVASPAQGAGSTRPPTKRLWNVWVRNGHHSWVLAQVAKSMSEVANSHQKDATSFLSPSIGQLGLTECYTIHTTALAREPAVSMVTGSLHSCNSFLPNYPIIFG